jgi:hypothetical protein
LLHVGIFHQKCFARDEGTYQDAANRKRRIACVSRKPPDPQMH